MNYWVFYSQVVIADSSQDSQSRLPYSITNFLFSQKEKTLNDLIEDRWLAYTPSGKIGLGIRSFLDLRSWFRGNDIPCCVVCNEAGIKVLMWLPCDCACLRLSSYSTPYTLQTFFRFSTIVAVLWHLYCLHLQQASTCPGEGCNVRIHNYCLKKKFSQRKVVS